MKEGIRTGEDAVSKTVGLLGLWVRLPHLPLRTFIRGSINGSGRLVLTQEMRVRILLPELVWTPRYANWHSGRA